jgi:lipid-A-disaccharide synthase
MRIFLSAGEPSGDHHAAVLVRELRAQDPTLEFVGLGGPQLEAAGCRLVADLTRLAVMWFARVILSIHRFVDLARRAERSFLDARPDVCVLVDFPGFHWWLAWRAKRHGIPVVFYCPPQIWAWASWRIHKMRRLVDHVLSALPFEHEWFMRKGMTSTLVGHPFFDERELPAKRSHSRTVTARATVPHVLLLPGSRGQEIEGNLAGILRAAARVRACVPEARFTVAALHERHAARIREEVAASPAARGLGLVITAGQARDAMETADAAIAVSGSVSLELLAARVPTVIVYRIGAFAYVVQSLCKRVRFITLVNLLACRQPIGRIQPVLIPPRQVTPADPEAVFPEYLTVQDPAERVAAHVVEWLRDPAAIGRARARVAAVAARVAHPGSAARAASVVLAIAEGAAPAGQAFPQRRAA